MLLWLLWEFALFAFSCRAAWRWTAGRARDAEEFLLAALCADIALGCSIASAVSYLRLNGGPAYAVAAAALLLLSRPRRFPLYARRLGDVAVFRHPFLSAGLAAAFVPALILSLRPVQEIDSMNYLHYVLEWSANRLTPATFALNFVPFWETAFVPAWVLARTDTVFGLVALKPVVLAAAAVFLVGRELGVAPRIALLTSAASLAMRHYWWPYSGVSTLKNDGLAAAGALLVCLALLRAAARRRESAPESLALFACGAVFLSVKFSGPVLAAMGFALLYGLARPRWKHLAVAAAAVLATTGHYYVRNLLVYGNPVYPVEIRLGGWRLPGAADVSYTSILHTLHDARLWKAFFLPAGGVSPAGLLFPLVLAVSLALCVSLAAAVLWRRGRAMPSAWMSVFLLAAWWVYVRSPWSASSLPGDLGYVLNQLNSLRYAEGPLAACEMLIASLIGAPAAIAVAVVSLASRAWLLYRDIPRDLFSSAAVLAASAAALAVLLALAALPRPRLRAAVTAGVAAAVLVAGAPRIAERNRRHWADQWNPVTLPLRRAPASSIFVLEDPADLFAAHYVVAAARPDCDVRAGGLEELASAEPRYVVWLSSPYGPRPDHDGLAARMASRGYIPVIRNRLGILLERVDRQAAGPVEDAWLVLDDGLAAPGLPVDTGAPELRFHALQAGESVYLAGTRLLLRAGARRNTLLEAAPGTVLRFRNGAPPARPALDGLHELPPGSFISVEAGEGRWEALRESDGPFLRIRAGAATRWLALVAPYPPGTGSSPVTVRVRLRCPSGADCALWQTGAAGERSSPGAGAWRTHEILFRRSQKTGGGLVAAGRRNAGANDYVDIRAFEVLAGWSPVTGEFGGW